MSSPAFPPMGAGVLSATERHPLITPTGAAALDGLLEATDAPLWNHQAGDRLDRAGRHVVRALADRIVTDPPRWEPDRPPAWVAGFRERLAATVPLHRTAPPGPHATTSRADLAGAWWDLVPDDADLDDLIWFPTSGTGGAPVRVPTHPTTVASYYPLLLAAARWHGVDVALRADRADWVTVVHQGQGGFTVPAWSSVLGCATAKVNLHPTGWRAPEDRRTFLERHDPQVLTGDPVSLSALADLDLDLHPGVAFSTALHLTTATRSRLESSLGCPVIDVYSTLETGPIAAARPVGGMGLLQPGLFVEVVDDAGRPMPAGSPGAVVVSGGVNPYLPLLRYRTGDTARMEWSGGQPVLHDLSGRPVVTLRGADGPVPSLDVVQVLEPLPLRRWSVHQAADSSVTVAVDPEGAGLVDADVVAAVRAALGPVAVTVVPLTAPDKVVPFLVEDPT